MELILTSAIAFALSQICLSILLVSRNKGRLVLQEWLFIIFLITAVAYLLAPLFENHWFNPLRKVIENLLPGVFWLLCSSLFDDRFRLSPLKLALVGFTVLMPLLGMLLNQVGGSTPSTFFEIIPQALEFVLLALALLAVILYWKDDLVETRRNLRLWFFVSTGSYIVGLIALREIFHVQANWFTLWQYLPVGIICLVTNLLLVQYRPGLLNFNTQTQISQVTPEHEAESKIKPDTVTQVEVVQIDVPTEIVEELDRLMGEQFIYREMGLTIGQLAERLNLPEYRLRKIINAGLGYRNFNDYLNGFRIKEAGERLIDPSQSGEAVLNIALDTGFRSLSSFNKAFREVFGVTPTVYRQQQGDMPSEAQSVS